MGLVVGGDTLMWDANGEDRSLAHLAGHADGAAMELDKPLGQRQPQPGAFTSRVWALST